VHLPGVRIAEFAHLEINHNQAPKTAVKEEQINAEPCVIDPEPLLPSEKRKIISKFNQEIGEMLDKRFFEIRLLRRIPAL